MANNNNYNSYNNQQQPSRGGFTPAPAAPVVAKAIPENYVDLAEEIMHKELTLTGQKNKKSHYHFKTAQLVQHCERYL